MAQHGVATPPPEDGRVVLSRLPSGDSLVLSTLVAAKLVIEGEEVHEIDGRPYVLRPGTMLLVDPGASYGVTVRRDRKTLGMCVYLPTKVGDHRREFPLLGRALLQAVDASPVGRLLWDTAVKMHAGRVSLDQPAALIENVGANLSLAMRTASDNIDRLAMIKPVTRQKVLDRLECARAFLHGNTDRSVPLSELASIVGMSSFHLARYFSEVYGAPPARYHRTVRLELAAQRLTRGDRSATDIALRAGYSDLSAFSHAFRRHFGMAPSAMELQP
ncbi:MAG: AraC family transcriptional regulator [Sphingomonas sp.]